MFAHPHVCHEKWSKYWLPDHCKARRNCLRTVLGGMGACQFLSMASKKCNFQIWYRIQMKGEQPQPLRAILCESPVQKEYCASTSFGKLQDKWVPALGTRTLGSRSTGHTKRLQSFATWEPRHVCCVAEPCFLWGILDCNRIFCSLVKILKERCQMLQALL